VNAVLTPVAGGLTLAAWAAGFEVMSALNSSPWTAENFGGDSDKAASCREYTLIAVGINIALGVGTSLLVGSWYPLVGVCAISVFMYWIYERAIARGRERNSTGWGSTGTPMIHNGMAGIMRVS